MKCKRVVADGGSLSSWRKFAHDGLALAAF